MARRWPFFLMATLSALVAIGSWRFLILGLDLSFPDFDDHIDLRPLPFIVHVSLAPAALVLGLFQFMPRLRAKRPAIHRATGRLYVLCVGTSGLAGLWLSLFAPGGPVAGVGFGALALLWISVTGVAVAHAINRNIPAHRAWMIRSFALTLAGVTLRLYLGGILLSGGGYTEASPWLAWLCWVPNIIVAEWWIARERARHMSVRN